MWSSCRWMPDNADSIGYGTSTRLPSVRPVGGASPAAAPANCQTPSRLRQAARRSCGRGYSGSALVGKTSLVHGVVSGGLPAFHPSVAAAPVGSVQAEPVDAPRVSVDPASSPASSPASTTVVRTTVVVLRREGPSDVTQPFLIGGEAARCRQRCGA